VFAPNGTLIGEMDLRESYANRWRDEEEQLFHPYTQSTLTQNSNALS
jgi:hypothetical protein